jgi:copper resistance protein B
MSLLLAALLGVQAMDHAHMPGMTMPAPTPEAPESDPACTPEHAAMGHCTPAPAPSPEPAAAGTALPPGNAPPPPAPPPTYADRIWGADAMAASRTALRREHGGGTFSQVMLNLAEWQIRDGRDGYRWDGEGWFGGDIDRLVIKSEGEGGFGDRVEHAEVQALYARAIGPYFNLQAGLRHDFRRQPQTTHAVIAIEGLAPYWFDVEGALFLSHRGDVTARAEATYDQRITQRLILQPRAELNFSVQRVAEQRIGAGLTDAELGLRLRYEIAREFAPYVGMSWERRYGATARYARAAGDRTGGASLVLGLRAWL